MKLLKKILKGILIAVLALLLLVAAADAAWIYVPQLTAQRSIGDIGDYAKGTDEISVPDGAKVIALGEASHGNVEFQEMKLSVLRQLVEKQGVRAFALETDFGEGMEINRYIHGQGELTDPWQAVGLFSFSIYHTQQMAELIEWMREYNMDAPAEEQLSFYGFDLQNPRTNVRLLAEFCRRNGVLPEKHLPDVLLAYTESAYGIADPESAESVAAIESIKAELTDNAADYTALPDYPLMLRACECVLQCVECMKADPANYIGYNQLRDGYMAENVQWIQDYEQSLGHGKVMIAGHNGHVACKAQFFEPMGSHLKMALGDKYFVIGTDYYKTVCNINNVGADTSRGDHGFCSADPLAAQAKALGGAYYLRFDQVGDPNGDTAETIGSPIYMGSLGEGYSFMMHLLPMSQRIKDTPAELYDAMLLTYEASPIRVVE